MLDGGALHDARQEPQEQTSEGMVDSLGGQSSAGGGPRCAKSTRDKMEMEMEMAWAGCLSTLHPLNAKPPGVPRLHPALCPIPTFRRPPFAT
jgi:hypothetical protein